MRKGATSPPAAYHLLISASSTSSKVIVASGKPGVLYTILRCPYPHGCCRKMSGMKPIRL
jgi:hypothetical protein